MAEITNNKFLPFFRHFKSSPLMYVLHYKKGVVDESGAGLTFYFRPTNSAMAEIPLDNREQTVMFKGISKDFQTVNVQASITYRIHEPDAAAESIDFTVNPTTGQYQQNPDQKLELLFSQLIQGYTQNYLLSQDVADILNQGVTAVQALIAHSLSEEEALTTIGLVVVAVRVQSVSPSIELEKALRTPVTEQLQMAADDAVVERRRNAIEKQAAVEQADKDNQIALAQQQARLIDQNNQNAEAETNAKLARQASETTARARDTKLLKAAEAEGIVLVGDANAEAEKASLAIWAEANPTVLTMTALRELAQSLAGIQSLTIAPDILSQLMQVNGGLVQLPAHDKGAVKGAAKQ